MRDTRSAIVDLLRSSGVTSRAELAKAAGLTAATISKIIRPLIDEGLVSEVGYADSTGGAPAILLQLNSAARYSIGISLDTARNVHVLTDLAGTPVRRRETAGLAAHSPQEAVDGMTREVRGLLADADVSRDDVVGLGLAAEGRLSAGSSALRSRPASSEWIGFDLRAALSDAIGLPVVLNNDANCAALGEFWSGRVPATRGFATVWMATGIGCGIVLDGDVYRGSSSNAGEIGHVIVDVNGPECWCGSRGCLEMLASPSAVVRAALEVPGLRDRLGLHRAVERGEDSTDVRSQFQAVATAARDGDPEAEALIRRSAVLLAKALIGVVNLLDLDLLYLAGPGFAEAGRIYLDVVRSELAQYSFLRAAHDVAVELSAVGADAAAIGGAASALHNHLTPHHSNGRG